MQPSFKLADELSSDSRTSRRVRVRVDATVRPGDEAEGGVAMIHDISTSGVLLESDFAIDHGARVTVDLPNAPETMAEVAWTNGNLYGCRFTVPVSEEVVRTVKAESPVIWPEFKPAARVGGAATEYSERELARLTHVPTTSFLHARTAIVVGISTLLWAAIVFAALS